MRTYLINLFKYVAMAIFVLPCALAFGQITPAATAVDEITRLENAVKERKALAQTRLALEALYKRAANTNNYVLQARSLNSLIKVKDQLTDDTLYFRNSAVIDTLLASPKTPSTLKSILYVMQARRISRFDQRPRRFGMDAYRVKNLPTDYTGLTFLQRITLSVKLLDSALAGTAPKPQDTAQFKWLASNPDFLMFTTRFEDVVLLEKVTISALSQGLPLNLHKTFSKILTLPSAAFIHAVDSLTSLGRDEPALHALKAYREWMVLHRTEDETKLFIEALARKSIYLYVEGDTVVNRRYIEYLQSEVNSKYDAIKAFAIYHLCLLWNQEGNRYKNFSDRYSYSPQFETRYQYYPVRALQLYEQNKLLMAKYPPFKVPLETMVAQIKAKALRIEMDDTFVPGDDIPFKVTYKNTDTLYYRIVKINPKEPAGNTLIIANDALIKRPVVSTGTFAMPLPADNNVHATYLKLAALPTGYYRLLMSYRPINAANDTLSNICIKVTGIVALNTDDRVFVLDRKTGSPLAGAGVQAFDTKTKAKTSAILTVPASGYVTVKNVADSLAIINKGDTLGYKPTASRNQINSNIYNKDKYDDLSEFYDDNVRMQVFVDRGIYRPGQTIHYKIIFFTNHPKTGQSVLLNKENLGGGVFKTLVKNWLNNGNDYIKLLDVFNKKVDSARLTINEFGSFAGSFVIPKTAATGQWHIVGNPKTDYQNSGLFKVEEYKRPSIALSMERQKKMLLPGQQFVIKLKLRSLNGSDLNNIAISYTITRNGGLPSNHPEDFYQISYNDDRLVDTTGYTDAQGELKITVNDTALSKAQLTDSLSWGYVYNIKAKAIDLTRESTEINDAITVTTRPVSINIDMPGVVDRNSLPAITIQTTNDFEGKLKRNVRVKIYKLNESPQGSNAIKLVDQWYYKEHDWNTWFPEKSTPQAAKPRDLVLDTVINTGTNEKLQLNKEKLGAGLYQLEAITRDGDHTLGQFSRRFNVFDSKAGEWVGDDINYFNLNTAKAGDEAIWFTSSRSENFSIYRSVYVNNKRKTITQYQTLLEKPGVRQWKYRVPADATGTVLISKISVKDNQLSRSERRVYIPPVSTTPRNNC
ncbi:MG2 domain-containing protein [Mucilaginibacter sp. HD30]